MGSRHSLALVFAAIFACIIFGVQPAAADGPTIQITAPQNGATVPGSTFELSWTSDPAVVGTAVAIMVDGHILLNYYQNAAENHLQLPVPPTKAGKACSVSIISYWQAVITGEGVFPTYGDGVSVTFADSIGFLEPSAAEGQSGATFTVTWKGLPELTGTALRLELWRAGSKVQDLGYVWDYSTVDGSWTGPMPHVDRGDGYSVRIVSLYQEAHGPFLYWTWGESDQFGLNALPFVQVLSPASGAQWGNDVHHILWLSDPAYFGTAARVELWRNGRFYMLLGYKWDCAEENDLEIASLSAEPSSIIDDNRYQVRVISLWQEAHPQFGINADDFSDSFLIYSTPLGRLVDPGALSNWVADENGKYRVNYESTPSIMGTAVRFDLWKGNRFFKTLGYNWDNQSTNSVLLDNPKVADDRDYYLRVVSIWLESHPTPLVPTYVENRAPISISSAPPFFFRNAIVDVNGMTQWLNLSWHQEWEVVGTNFRLELWPKHQQTLNEHYVIAYPQYNTEEHTQSYLLPPLPTDETQYYVRISSYWQEQIQGPYQYIETPWLVTVPYPRQ